MLSGRNNKTSKKAAIVIIYFIEGIKAVCQKLTYAVLN